MKGNSRKRPCVGLCDSVFTIIIWVAGIVGLLLPASIIGFLFYSGFRVISLDFVLNSPGGLPLGAAGGIRPAIEGSLALVGIGLTVALPWGIGCAVCLSEFGKLHPVFNLIRLTIETLAAIPAIIFGLFAYSFFVVYLKMNVSLLSGGLTLGLLMLPQIIIGTHATLQSIDTDLREAVLALGVSRIYLLRRVVLPKSWPGILAITVIAAGHALGSAAPILFTASVFYSKGGLDLGAPVMSLPTHLYHLATEVNIAGGASLSAAYGTALVLVIILLISNAVVMFLKTSMRG